MKHSIDILITVLTALAMQVVTWFVLYPLAGYNNVTLLVSQSVILLLGIMLVGIFRLNWRCIGSHWKDFLRAIAGIAAAYSLLFLLLLALKHFEASIPLFRPEYKIYPFFNNWLLTGFGEELLFAGIIFNLLTQRAKFRKWVAVMFTASIFAIWHLPGYLAIGLKTGMQVPDLVFNLLLHLVSWGFLGTIYWFSGNLWLTAFAHASTDYALLPAITQLPQMGLVFMFMLLVIGYLIRVKTHSQTCDQRVQSIVQ